MNKSTLQQPVYTSINHAVQSNKRIRFLCAHHRDWVYFHSQEAFENLDQMQLKGEFLLEHQKWVEALPFLGSAWETTEILLELHSGEKASLANRFGCLTLLLCASLEKQDHKQCADQINIQAQSILETTVLQLEEGSQQKTCLMNCIQQLNTALRHPVNILPWTSESTNVVRH